MEDVRDVTKQSAPDVDMVIGGFPCQDVSISGGRRGLDGGRSRSGLWFEFHRIISELRPRIAVVENVPGLFSSNGGRDFATILRGLSEQRYMSAWRVLDAQFFGLPQRRRRVFFVASLGDGACAEILFERESVRRDTTQSRKTRPGAAGGSEGCAGGSYIPEVAQPIRLGTEGRGTAANSDGSGNMIAGAIPINTMAATRPESSDQNRQTMGVGEPGDPMYTIQAGHHHAVHCIDMGGGNSNTSISENISHTMATSGPHAVSATVTAKWAKQAGGPAGSASETDNCVIQDTVGTLDKKCYGDRGDSSDADKMVIQDTAEPLAATLTHHNYADRGNSSDCSKLITQSQTGAVRRLTPVECCRLQGFPDDWNDDQTDSQRYRQMGNAVTVNVAEWLGRRIAEYGE